MRENVIEKKQLPKKGKKFIKRYKAVLIPIGLIFVFGIYNLLWFINYASYNRFLTDSYIKLDAYSYIYDSEEGWIFFVKKPDYLSFTGNLHLSRQSVDNELLIWPSLFREDRYGVSIYTGMDGEIYTFIDIMIDNQGNCISGKQEDEKLIEENAESINELLQVYREWATP